jgi:hypothetical protein
MKKSVQISNKIARKVQKHADSWASAYWHRTPFCETPKADKETYLNLWEKARKETFGEIDALEQEYGFAADKTWLDDLALHTQIVIKESSLCYQHGRVLYATLSKFIKDNPTLPSLNIIETGTARGFSSIVMSKALDDAKKDGRILTFDLLPHDQAILWNCLDDLNGPRSRRNLLKSWQALSDRYIVFIEGDSRLMLNRFRTGRIHFAFLDGAHSFQDVTAELAQIAPWQQSGDIIVFDDYSPSKFPGLVKAVDEGCMTYKYDKKVIKSKDDRAYVIARKL